MKHTELTWQDIRTINDLCEEYQEQVDADLHAWMMDEDNTGIKCPYLPETDEEFYGEVLRRWDKANEGKSPSEGTQSDFADVRKNEEKLNKVVAAVNDMPLENELTDEQLDTYWRTCYNAYLDCDMEKHKRGL